MLNKIHTLTAWESSAWSTETTVQESTAAKEPLSPISSTQCINVYLYSSSNEYESRCIDLDRPVGAVGRKPERFEPPSSASLLKCSFWTPREGSISQNMWQQSAERERGGGGVYHCNRPTGVQLPLVWAVIIIMIIIIIIIIIKIIITIMSFKKQWQRSHEKLMGKYLKGHIVNLFLAMSLSLSLSLCLFSFYIFTCPPWIE